MERNDMIGAACAAVAIGLVAWSSLQSWAVADCRDILRVADFQRAGDADPVMAAELAAFRTRLEAGNVTSEVTACVSRIGLPF